MLEVKKKGNTELVFMRNNHPDYIGGYSLIMQNTVTKSVKIYNVDDIGNTLYIKFNVDIDLEDGEYIVLLFENPSFVPFYANTNDIKDITYIKYVVNDTQLLTSGIFTLVYGMGEQRITWISSDLLKMGEYKNTNKQYGKQQGYIQYNN